MAQQFDYPKTETDLRATLDALYQTAKTAYDSGQRPAVNGLIEIMSAQTTIITAIHNIKSNKGSKTPGVDGKNMERDYLRKPFQWVISDIQSAFHHYTPKKIRREYIDKPGKAEKRPLGIPTIRDRIVQECIRIVLEPILEAQFWEHSYGFRPMRDTHQALERVTDLVHTTGYHWIVEGDISKCFDKIDHRILLKRLYHVGIHDRRVIQIVKAMLEAGIIGECEVNEEGVSQGSVLSPLLANLCLDMLDEWVSRQWERKETRYPYKLRKIKYSALRESSQLMPGYIVRYADDFVIVTDTHEHAQSWKTRICEFLSKKMRLTLSTEKTLITDVRKRYIHFLGYEYKVVKGKARKGYLCRTLPDRKRLKRKVDAIAKYIKDIPHSTSREQVIKEICLINSQIRGLINYYQNCTWVNLAMDKHRSRLRLVTMHWLKAYKGKWIPANKTQNLVRVHEKYRGKIPAVEYKGMFIGVTDLTFVRWQVTGKKNQAETPFTKEGRALYFQRTKKKRQNDRLDSMYSPRSMEQISRDRWGKHFDFEFYMNRAYALNRDRLKCRVCGGWLTACTPYAHRIDPHLPQNKVNKVGNLASMHKECMDAVNNLNADLSRFDSKARRKIAIFREKLDNSHVKTVAKMERRVR